MNNDRELLEQAAKAAGIEWIWQQPCDFISPMSRHEPRMAIDGYWKLPCGQTQSWWNPLTDDGDALRLAVKLNIYFRRYRNPDFFRERVGGYVEAVRNDIEEREPVGDDPYAATRRAIVCAAAEIGKEQK